MATYYWVGGSGTWDNSNTANWSASSGGAGGAGFPVSGDTAILNASSGGGTVALGANVTMSVLTLTGFTGTIDWGTNTISLAGTGNVFTGDTTYNVSGTPVINVTAATAANRTITPGAVTEANSISFNVTAGTGNFTHVGTGNAVRDLNFTGFAGAWGSGQRTIYGSLTISTGMTVTTTTSVTTFAATSAQTITTNGKTIDAPVTFNGVGGTWTFTDALTLGSTRALTLTNGTLRLKEGVTSTVGSFVAATGNRRTLCSAVAGTAATLSDASGTNTLSNVALQDIAATGGATWLAYFALGNVNLGNVTGFLFFPPGLSAGRGLSVGTGLYKGSSGLWNSRVGL